MAARKSTKKTARAQITLTPELLRLVHEHTHARPPINPSTNRKMWPSYYAHRKKVAYEIVTAIAIQLERGVDAMNEWFRDPDFNIMESHYWTAEGLAANEDVFVPRP